MNKQDIGKYLFLIISITLALIAALNLGSMVVWRMVFIGAASGVIVSVALFFRKYAPEGSGGIPRPVDVPQHLKVRLAERVAEVNERVKSAKLKLAETESALNGAKNELSSAVSAEPQNADAVLALQENVRQRQQDFDEAHDNVRFEESQLDKLMSPGGMEAMLDRVNWATVLQYGIFASLALYVLITLMTGITSSPPAGTTPRGMITMLISVVVVGIALILVLSTIVSEKMDDKRFSQGKEVLTALLGVLGTIVGFYFGISQDPVSTFIFDPAVVTTDADGPVAVSTSVRGGKAPYFYDATFTPLTIPGDKQKTDGPIALKINTKHVKEDAVVSVLIVVTDSAGTKGSVEFTQLAQVKGADSE